MKDKIALGSLAGIFGAFISASLALIINISGITKIKLFSLTSAVFLPSEIVNSLVGNIYGFFIHLMLGAAVGLILVLCPSILKEDCLDNYLLYKGFLLGGFSWLFVGGILGNLLSLPIKSDFLANSLYGFLNLIFGISTILAAHYLKNKK